MKPVIVCLCGSTRFKAAYERLDRQESLAGRVVFSAAGFAHADGLSLSDVDKRILDEVRKRKIDLADEILVVDEPLWYCPTCKTHGVDVVPVGATGAVCAGCGELPRLRPYVDESTRREIEYARGLGKRVRYLSEESPATLTVFRVRVAASMLVGHRTAAVDALAAEAWASHAVECALGEYLRNAGSGFGGEVVAVEATAAPVPAEAAGGERSEP